MGTRADFYAGRGASAEWLGSIAWDGYPDGIDDAILKAAGRPDFDAALESFLASRKDTTRPAQGWPWPWDDSGTTDYAYAFDDGKVWASCFGGAWFDPCLEFTDDEHEAIAAQPGATFPNMAAKKSVAWGDRSGVIAVGGPA